MPGTGLQKLQYIFRYWSFWSSPESGPRTACAWTRPHRAFAGRIRRPPRRRRCLPDRRPRQLPGRTGPNGDPLPAGPEAPGRCRLPGCYGRGPRCEDQTEIPNHRRAVTAPSRQAKRRPTETGGRGAEIAAEHERRLRALSRSVARACDRWLAGRGGKRRAIAKQLQKSFSGSKESLPVSLQIGCLRLEVHFCEQVRSFGVSQTFRSSSPISSH